MTLGNPIEAALSNPWGALQRVLDGPLHPGGHEATERLLDRAAVTDGTRLLDVGCGAGDAVTLARERGAEAVGLDRDPDGPGTVQGDLSDLPVGDGAVDVVLAECSLCLADDLDHALAEARRVTGSGGQLALSDVVVEGDAPPLPDAMTTALCLDGPREREYLRDRVETAGYTVGSVQDHREDLLAMREAVASSVDYEGLLGLMGERGQRILDGIEELEAAVEDGHIGYVSMVATAE